MKDILTKSISTGEVVKKKKETDNSVSNISLWEQLTNYKEFSCTGGSYGLMNGDKILLPCEWDDFHYLDNGIYTYLSSKGKKYIIGEKNKKSYLINLKIKK